MAAAGRERIAAVPEPRPLLRRGGGGDARILIDRARKRAVRQPSGLAAPEELHESRLEIQAPTDELLAVHEGLDGLASVDASAAELVKLRYFVGMTVAEAGESLGLPLRSAERLWTFSRAWLRDALGKEQVRKF